MSACRRGDEGAASTSSSILTSVFQHKAGDFVTALALVVLWGCGDDAGAATSGPPPPEPVCTLPQGAPHVVAIEGAEAFSLLVALLSNGDLYCWGNDGVGACGSKFLNPVRSGVASCLVSVKLEAGTLTATEAWSPPPDPARPLLVWGYDARRNLETDTSGLGALKAHLGAQVHAAELDPSEPDVELVGPPLAALAVEPPIGVSFAALTMVPSKLRVSLELFQTAEATGPQTGQISIAIILRREVPPTYDVLA
jgi:hypothetical protein